jgi:hypothetical protein
MVFLYIFHGIDESIRDIANDKNLDMIIGYGAGKPPSYSCDPKIKDAFIYYLDNNDLCAYEGRSGGYYSGVAKNNLNQYFRRWNPNKNVQSMQVEIVNELVDPGIVEVTAQTIASCMDDILLFDDATDILISPKKF